MIKSTIAAAAILGVLTAGIPTPASADISPAWKLQNSGASYTGAVFHRAADGQIYGNAVIIEPGGDQRKIRVTVDTNQDWPYGIKVWQPAGSCLKVYEHFIVWFRVHKYRPVDHGRDVWVTQGLGGSGEKFRTKILRDC